MVEYYLLAVAGANTFVLFLMLIWVLGGYKIKSFMDMILEMANLRGIQVIITTHSTHVIDSFAEIPESIFLLSKENGETKVKNLKKDILNSTGKRSKKAAQLEINNHPDSLSEHWTVKLLDGVAK